MAASENFVLRWARLKGEAASSRRAEPAMEAAQSATTVAPDAGLVAVQHGNAAADETFDLASLPSIDAIAADTDIRAFLHSRVPAELARLALRRAWASDPAIRDFIGIAENQWDFNDPDGMPGFGPLLGGDNLPDLLQEALGSSDRLEQTMAASLPASREQVQSPVADRGPVNSDRSPGQTLEAPVSTGSDVPGLAVGGDGEAIAISSDRVIGTSEDALYRRSHGSALPRSQNMTRGKV